MCSLSLCLMRLLVGSVPAVRTACSRDSPQAVAKVSLTAQVVLTFFLAGSWSASGASSSGYLRNRPME